MKKILFINYQAFQYLSIFNFLNKTRIFKKSMSRTIKEIIRSKTNDKKLNNIFMLNIFGKNNQGVDYYFHKQNLTTHQ